TPRIIVTIVADSKNTDSSLLKSHTLGYSPFQNAHTSAHSQAPFNDATCAKKVHFNSALRTLVIEKSQATKTATLPPSPSAAGRYHLDWPCRSALPQAGGVFSNRRASNKCRPEGPKP